MRCVSSWETLSDAPHLDRDRRHFCLACAAAAVPRAGSGAMSTLPNSTRLVPTRLLSSIALPDEPELHNPADRKWLLSSIIEGLPRLWSLDAHSRTLRWVDRVLRRREALTWHPESGMRDAAASSPLPSPPRDSNTRTSAGLADGSSLPSRSRLVTTPRKLVSRHGLVAPSAGDLGILGARGRRDPPVHGSPESTVWHRLSRGARESHKLSEAQVALRPRCKHRVWRKARSLSSP
ncbi:hypothetical protein B0T11DRAFT_110267 [Plectosphaerella cucumerina]|uniref:Uncharacterized protein n=1 Tax=Plectosphaerella cucumerina TaxID=40658 RepID=A0A8K0X3N0_9PEZI|nr:hypothetical protein B0T11DRAFT_110267 [Plectosphaerella cucumerina]